MGMISESLKVLISVSNFKCVWEDYFRWNRWESVWILAFSFQLIIPIISVWKWELLFVCFWLLFHIRMDKLLNYSMWIKINVVHKFTLCAYAWEGYLIGYTATKNIIPPQTRYTATIYCKVYIYFFHWIYYTIKRRLTNNTLIFVSSITSKSYMSLIRIQFRNISSFNFDISVFTCFFENNGNFWLIKNADVFENPPKWMIAHEALAHHKFGQICFQKVPFCSSFSFIPPLKRSP